MKTDIVRNMIIVLLKGILTPAEKKLAESLDGMLSIKRIRADLIESGNDQLKELLETITGVKVSSFHTDVSTRTGERIIIFLMQESME